MGRVRGDWVISVPENTPTASLPPGKGCSGESLQEGPPWMGKHGVFPGALISEIFTVYQRQEGTMANNHLSVVS